MVLIVALGVALRVTDYLRRTSLNIDESRIALNLGMRSFGGLLPPLDHAQSAPLLFLWTEKLMVGLAGWSELTLRAVPLLTGIATVVLMVPVARRLTTSPTDLLAVALTAVAPGLVHFSAVLKQYSLEAMLSVLLLWRLLVWRDFPTSGRAWGILVATGTVALWGSAPAVFFVVGVWLALALAAVRRDAPWSKVWAAGIVWGGSFALAYTMDYRRAARDPYLQHFWAPAFVRVSDLASLRNAAVTARSLVWGGPMETLPFIPRVPAVLVAFHITTVLLVAAVIWGGRRLARRSEAGLAVVAGLLATAVATLAGLYPLVQRTSLFAIPFLQLCIAVGLAAAVRRLSPGYRAASWAATFLVVLVPSLWVSALTAINFNPPYDVAPLVRLLQARRGRGEPIYIGAGAIPAWCYYSTDWSRPDTARIQYFDRMAAPGGPAFENAPKRGAPIDPEAGADLVYPASAGEEILGLPSGIESTALTGPVGSAVPDSGWASHEASRIRSRAHPAIWVLMAHHRPVEMSLFNEVENLGGRRTLFRDRNSATLARYEFDRQE